MARGTAIHIGLSRVNASIWGLMPAPGCDAAASDMARLTNGLGYSAATTLIDNAATKAAAIAAFRQASASLADNDMLCLSYAGHGIAYDDSTGAPQVAFMMYDQPWLRGEFLQLLTPIDKRVRIAIVMLACYGPLSDATTQVIEAHIRQSGAPFARVLPFRRAVEFWHSSAGWHLWANTHSVFTVSSRASVLIVAASREDGLAQSAPHGRRLPTFTEALIAGAATAANYPDLVQYIQDQMIDSGSLSTPVLNRSLVRPDDQGFPLTKPFSLTESLSGSGQV